MKRNIIYLITVLLVITLLGTCAPVLVEFVAGQTIGTAENSEANIYLTHNTAQNLNNNITGNPFRYTGVSEALNYTDDTTGDITLTFINGVVDAAAIAAAITIYPLSDAANPWEPYVQGAAITYTSTVTENGTGSLVVLNIDPTALPTDSLEIVIAPTLTANGGLVTLNQDSDATPGETEDTAIVNLINAVAGGAPAVITGFARNPQALIGAPVIPVTFTINGENYIAMEPGDLILGENIGATPATESAFGLVDTNGNIGGIDENLSAATISPGLQVSLFNADTGAWSAVSGTLTYDAVAASPGLGNVTYTLPAAAAVGQFYRARLDYYNITESAAVGGYVHRGTYDPDSATRYAYLYYYVVGDATAAGWITSISDAGSNNARTITVNLSSDLNTATLSNYSLEVWKDEAVDKKVQWVSYTMEDANSVILNLSSSVTTGSFYVVAKPLLLDEAGDPFLDKSFNTTL
jgi:hypothetical protein